MKFCENCNNTLFLKIISSDEQDEDSKQPDKLYYTCKKCNYKKEHSLSAHQQLHRRLNK